jgi:hypothetical protein
MDGGSSSESEKQPIQYLRSNLENSKKPPLRKRLFRRLRDDKPTEKVSLPIEGEIVITSKIQQSNFDCGQTVLDMLGYDGHKMFPNREISSGDLRSIPGAEEVTLPVGREEELDYTYPKVWIFIGKGKVAGPNHWVIRHKEKIYCPSVGEMNAAEYKTKYVGFVLQEFDIPVKNNPKT